MDTYLLISSTWTSSFFLGYFLGPTLAGFTVEYFGFRATTFGFAIVYAVMSVIDFLELAYSVKLNKQVNVTLDLTSTQKYGTVKQY